MSRSDLRSRGQNQEDSKTSYSRDLLSTAPLNCNVLQPSFTISLLLWSTAHCHTQALHYQLSPSLSIPLVVFRPRGRQVEVAGYLCRDRGATKGCMNKIWVKTTWRANFEPFPWKCYNPVFLNFCLLPANLFQAFMTFTDRERGEPTGTWQRVRRTERLGLKPLWCTI